MRKFTPEQELQAVSKYRAGSSMNDVAAEFGVSRPAVRMLLRRRGETLRPRKPPRPTKLQEVIEKEVVQLRLAGIRVRDIATKVGVSTQTVSEILITGGLHTRLKRGENSTARRRFSPEEDKQVAQEYLAGATTAKLAEKYGCTLVTVRDAILRTGTAMRRRGGVIAPFSRDPAFRLKVKAMWDRGMTQTAIGEALGCSQGVVSTVLRDLGIKCRAGGARHGGWKGGKSANAQGYVLVLLPSDHPFASMRSATGYVLEHRLVMAEYLGRPLLPHETVHHKDGDRTRNKIENLQLRIGKHGQGACYRCSDCGSTRLEPVEL